MICVSNKMAKIKVIFILLQFYLKVFTANAKLVEIEISTTSDGLEDTSQEETPRPFLKEPISEEAGTSESHIENSMRSNSTTDHVMGGTATCLCGKSIAKIVGGENAKINDLPWTALLYKRGFFGGKSPYCGGTLINDRYLVTANHCVDGMTSKGIDVVLKEENTATSSESKSYSFTVSKIIMHPDYNRRKIDNDIALLRLSNPVELSANGPFVPACVPSNNGESFEGQDAIAAGWGATREGGSVSKVLKRVTVPILSNEECDMTRYKGRITQNMLCAGFIKEGGRDSCQGDSGGPLVVKGNNSRHILVGVVSWGYGCAKKNSPGVYARVSQYPDWIASNTQDAVWCNE